MKKILATTDFTEYADYAVEAAISIAKKTGAKLLLLHVADRPIKEDDDPDQYYYNTPSESVLTSSALKKLKALVKSHDLTDAEVIEETRYDVHGTILRIAEEHRVDLIVMGAYGTSGPEEPFIGSNTERVMRLSDCPVLTVKEKYDDFKVENMVFASAFLDETHRVFPKIKAFAELFNAKVHLLKVNTPARFEGSTSSKELMHYLAQMCELPNYTVNVVNDLSIEDGILKFSDEVQADVISITTHGRRRLAHLIMGNLTDYIMKDSAKAILSVKIKKTPSSKETPIREASRAFRMGKHDYNQRYYPGSQPLSI